jgi:hypothetical protein
VIQARPVDPEIIATDEAPLIPPGRYEAIGGRAFDRGIFRTRKLYVPFTVIVPNPSATWGTVHVRLWRHYNVRTSPDSRITTGPMSDLYREWVTVMGRKPARRDRLSRDAFKGVLCLVEVRTVMRDFRQQDLAAPAHYSVISRVIERRAGGGPPCI